MIQSLRRHFLRKKKLHFKNDNLAAFYFCAHGMRRRATSCAKFSPVRSSAKETKDAVIKRRCKRPTTREDRELYLRLIYRLRWPDRWITIIPGAGVVKYRDHACFKRILAHAHRHVRRTFEYTRGARACTRAPACNALQGRIFKYQNAEGTPRRRRHENFQNASSLLLPRRPAVQACFARSCTERIKEFQRQSRQLSGHRARKTR